MIYACKILLYQARINGQSFFLNLKQKQNQKKSVESLKVKRETNTIKLWKIDVKNGRLWIKKKKNIQLKTSSL